MAKILFVSRTFPRAHSSGSDEMNLNVIRHLKDLGHDVHYLFLHFFQKRGDEIVGLCTLHFGNCATEHYDIPGTAAEAACVKSFLTSLEPSIVIADYSWVANVLDVVPASIPKVVLLHDLRCRIIPDFERAGMYHDHHPWTRDEEAAMLSKADAIICINPEDESECAVMAPGVPVVRISLASPIHLTDIEDEIPGRVFYVGSDCQENVIALSRFLEESWPTVLRYSPQAKLHVAGRICQKIEWDNYRNVLALGRIGPLTRQYSEARCCIIPAFHGGGIKLKFIGAIAHGRAVVANRCGIDGFPEADGTCALIASSSHEFAMHVVSVLQDGLQRRRMQSAARDIAFSRLSETASYGPLREYFISKGLCDT